MPEVFVYGTLTDPERARRVTGVLPAYRPARLDGLHRVEGRYPTLAPAPAGHVTGRLLAVDSLEPVDAYEGIDSGLYVRVRLDDVWTYVGDPERLGADATWAGHDDEPFRARMSRYLERGDVSVHPA
jgi:gamma-glutamylcyclotransferase (GGCT)/AIG2-like uncharacterized protein YtfP